MYVRGGDPNYVPVEAWYKPSGVTYFPRPRSPFGSRAFGGLGASAPKMFGSDTPSHALFDVRAVPDAELSAVFSAISDEIKNFTLVGLQWKVVPVVAGGEEAPEAPIEDVVALKAMFPSPVGWFPSEVRDTLNAIADRVGASLDSYTYPTSALIPVPTDEPADTPPPPPVELDEEYITARTWAEKVPNALWFLAVGAVGAVGVYAARDTKWFRAFRRKVRRKFR